MISLEQTPVTIVLLAINIIASVWLLSGNHQLFGKLAMSPYRIRHNNEIYRIITGQFIHANWPHLLFNMMTLFFFGPVLEQTVGGIIFLIIYLGSDIGAALMSLLRHSNNAQYMAVGASGAISGVLTSFSLIYPWHKIYLFFIPVGIPAIIFTAAFIILSYFAMKKQSGGGLAHDAHLGGAVAGIILTIILIPSVISHFMNEILK